ncbi:MAG: type II secretion system protein [Patescibacteria group bacterium]
MKIQWQNKKGMTLLDLIIWMSIFGMLTTSMIASFRDGNRGDGVRQSARLAESLLRRAQTMTLSGTVLLNGDYPNGGYGVRFDTGQSRNLILFGDVNGNFKYDAGEEIAGSDVLLPINTAFSLGASLDVVFSPPDGDVYFNGLAAPDTTVVSFVGTGTSITKAITVFRLSGQVRVE